MNIINITESNYQDYSSLDIVAFSFAYAGAMGEHGGIYIIDRGGHIYHANYCHGDDHLDFDHVVDILPVVKDIEWRVFDSYSNNENWEAVELGMGNNLVMVKEIFNDFNKKAEESGILNSPPDLFHHWPGFVMGSIGKGNEELTMTDMFNGLVASFILCGLLSDTDKSQRE